MAFFLTIGHSRLVSVSGSLYLPWQLIIRCFELSDKTYSKTNFEPATRGSVRRASGLVLADHPLRNDIAVSTSTRLSILPSLSTPIDQGMCSGTPMHSCAYPTATRCRTPVRAHLDWHQRCAQRSPRHHSSSPLLSQLSIRRPTAVQIP